MSKTENKEVFISYDQRKCSCCKLVYCNTIIFTSDSPKGELFIMCFSCCKNVTGYIKKLKDSLEKL